jgi:hypothetical protein
VLATLVDAYEAEHHPIDPPDPIEAIKFRMEQQGLTRKDLERLLGTRTRVSEVLNRKRNLSIAMIRRTTGQREATFGPRSVGAGGARPDVGCGFRGVPDAGAPPSRWPRGG